MTLQSYLRDHSRPIVSIPIYFGYERVMEGKTYVAELSGKGRRKNRFSPAENRAFHRARVRQSACEFRRADLPGNLLDRCSTGAKKALAGGKAPYGWSQASIRCRTRLLPINSGCRRQPGALLSLVLLSTPKQSMDEEKLVEQLDLYRFVDDRGAVFGPHRPEQAGWPPLLEYGERMKVLQRMPASRSAMWW